MAHSVKPCSVDAVVSVTYSLDTLNLNVTARGKPCSVWWWLLSGSGKRNPGLGRVCVNLKGCFRRQSENKLKRPRVYGIRVRNPERKEKRKRKLKAYGCQE